MHAYFTLEGFTLTVKTSFVLLLFRLHFQSSYLSKFSTLLACYSLHAHCYYSHVRGFQQPISQLVFNLDMLGKEQINKCFFNRIDTSDHHAFFNEGAGWWLVPQKNEGILNLQYRKNALTSQVFVNTLPLELCQNFVHFRNLLPSISFFQTVARTTH